MISADAIENPLVWRLTLMVDGCEALRAVVSSTVEDSSLMHFTLPLDPTVPLLRSLEEAIYATPVLLSDFGKVEVLIRTDAYTLVPSALDAEGCRAAASIAALTADAGGPTCVMTDDTGTALARVVWTVADDVVAFLRRTFRNPDIMCHITPLLRYFSRKTLLGNSAKLYVHFNPGAARTADLIVFNPEGSLECAASHPCPTDTDAAYFILATARACGFSMTADEILICGDGSMRDAIMPLLRRYAAYVMPVIFPSIAFRAGREALKAPFPLIILPLCE